MVWHKFRQLGDIGRDAPRFVFGQQVGRCTSPRLVLEIDIGQRVYSTIMAARSGAARGGPCGVSGPVPLPSLYLNFYARMFLPNQRSRRSAPMPTTDTEQQQIYVAIWSKAVDTQMHFNEMSVKSRQFGLAFVAAALGLGIVLLTRNQDFSLPIRFFGGFDLNMTVLIAFGGAIALYAVMLLDCDVYHKMLRGAVAFGEDFEQNYMKEIFSLQKGMTQAISHFSRHTDASVKPQENGKIFLLRQ